MRAQSYYLSVARRTSSPTAALSRKERLDQLDLSA